MTHSMLPTARAFRCGVSAEVEAGLLGGRRWSIASCVGRIERLDIRLGGLTPSARRGRSERRPPVTGVGCIKQMREPAGSESRSVGKRDFAVHDGDRVVDQLRIKRLEVRPDGLLERDS